ncbi:MAG: hypothetical protein WHT06_00360 [Desulfobacterales bacterium]
MATRGPLFAPADMRFFGQVSAAVTHDVKNVLAVIQENAGLLEDLCGMAERGRPLDVPRLKRIARELQQQVGRGDRIITSMNRFAHSVDEDPKAVEVSGLLEMMAVLSRRFLAAKGLRLTTVPPAPAASVDAPPFGLIRLLWFCLEHTAALGAPGKTLELAFEVSGAGPAFHIRGFAPPANGLSALLSTESARALCATLGATLASRPEAGELVIRLSPPCVGGTGPAPLTQPRPTGEER